MLGWVTCAVGDAQWRQNSTSDVRASVMLLLARMKMSRYQIRAPSIGRTSIRSFVYICAAVLFL